MPCPASPNDALLAARNGVYPALAALGAPATEYLGFAGHGHNYGCGCTGNAGENGVLTVEWSEVSPTEDQDPSADGGFCGRTYRVYVTLRMKRCWQSWNIIGQGATDGAPVSAPQATATASLISNEGWLALMQLTSYMEDPVNGYDGCTWALESLSAIEPEGNCAGWQLNLTFDIEACA